MGNELKLSNNRRDAIATSIHQTVQAFSDRLPGKVNGLCLYYAGLGMDVCTVVYQKVSKDETLYYSLQGGSISVRVASDSEDVSKGVNFGAINPSFKTGSYHCWIVGLCKESQVITPFEFIDFTSKHYKSNSLEQGHSWGRTDIGDYLWLDQDHMEKYGVSFDCDKNITQQAIKAWSDISFKDAMLCQAIQNYKSIIQ
ncbi:MAG: hypothetical protein HWQ38_29295 [Nostoc sp. NMS7]|uniref:hypothetical protein n=1 Tax=Nostoc sp. NMS7 TaxID=2815391 RepID=UPI0025EF5D0C|nr:hypothetical protein [Nostoc sp. NMS7]MBN3950347.1 hypothetical protein [Nostoc sp. NMS7]